MDWYRAHRAPPALSRSLKLVPGDGGRFFLFYSVTVG